MRMRRTINVHEGGARMRILLIEDNAIARELLTQWFSLVPGAEVVHVATTSAAAAEWLSSHQDGWDLAVIDLFLADGHGFDVLRHCRGRAPHQRAVLLTNYTRDPVRESARRAGADAVFDKGSEMKSFIAWCRDPHTALAG
jgi:DNA-binding NarL/FixJ family response regulator